MSGHSLADKWRVWWRRVLLRCRGGIWLVAGAALGVLATAYCSPTDDPLLVVEGEDAALGQLPWQVSLRPTVTVRHPNGFAYAKGQHYCGGALIGDGDRASWVITAAHCVHLANGNGDIKRQILASEIEVASGIVELDEPGVSQSVQAIVVHPQFNAKFAANDVALLGLKPLNRRERLRWARSRKVVKMPDTRELDVKKPYTEVTASGWGWLEEGSREVSEVLQYVNVPVVDAKTCRRAFERTYGQGILDNMERTMLCAGFRSGGGAPCKGDSGGPLVAGVTAGAYGPRLVGIVNFSKGCGRREFFGVYADVTRYREWIHEQTDIG